ncbi:MAG: UBA/THIF-type NAD/FAD binding fold protein [Candidatus Gottesmanbacteria bacterium GW2011_GWA1_34_13]|uniref:UBA/THIF-type NAD/FAD binding fold protein n=1 Tax=Candidatus Gottesmanbacteria bacterium GW2011_GWA1_34_13 TaxID=1618434 RepID=A0A0G0AS42_9BACT|nr:MAG: UBA/THIF-type NAD/FAD binding fold protein [Candidatus Gottesmanbacteria bacterium GW2011_GWA1_34_13]
MIAAQKLGLVYELVTDFKDLSKTVARIIFTDRNRKSNHGLISLFSQIGKRVTNRQLYDGTLIEEKYISALKKIITENSSNFLLNAVSRQKDKIALVDALGKADVIRMTNFQAYKQMIGELRWNTEEVKRTRDGLDIKTLEMPYNLDKLFALVHKYHGIMKLLPKRVFIEITKPTIEGSSHVLCLSTNKKYNSQILFETGRIIEKIWLTATSWNISFQPWTISTFFIFRITFYKGIGFTDHEIEEIKKIKKEINFIFNLSDKDLPLFIFRLARAKKPSVRSLRLDWKDFTDFVSN